MKTSPFPLTDDPWTLIVPRGRFPHGDHVQVLEDESLTAILNRFRQQKRDRHFTGVLVDYDHDSLDPKTSSIAAGWIVDMRLDPEGLSAQIMWTQTGSESISNREFKCLSPAFKGYTKRADGTLLPHSLLSVGLTNVANLPGLVLKNSCCTTMHPNEMDYRLELCSYLGLGWDASDAEILEAIARKNKTGKVSNSSPKARLSWQPWQGGIPQLRTQQPARSVSLMNGLCAKTFEIAKRAKSPQHLRNIARQFPPNSLLRHKLEACADQKDQQKGSKK